jgi:hypothetical protein
MLSGSHFVDEETETFEGKCLVRAAELENSRAQFWFVLEPEALLAWPWLEA